MGGNINSICNKIRLKKQKCAQKMFYGKQASQGPVKIFVPPITIVHPVRASIVIQEAIKISTARLCLLHSF